MKVWPVICERDTYKASIIASFYTLEEAKRFLGERKKNLVLGGRKTRNLRNNGKYIGFKVISAQEKWASLGDQYKYGYTLYVEKEGAEIQ